MVSIVFVSAHYPLTTFYAQRTRVSFEKYTAKHGYGFYYDADEPAEKAVHALHFMRCESIRKAAEKYPEAEWFVWVDSDVYVGKPEVPVESQIDLSNPEILYHLFHEAPWGCYPINTGVKFVHRNALVYEAKVWSLRNTHPWNTFPFEQKTIYEHILPQIKGKYIIHDPYVLNCIINAYPEKVKDALFVHMCCTLEKWRDEIIKKVSI